MGKYREVDQELLNLVAKGKTGRQISEILNLDYSTVHAKLRKLDVSLKKLNFDPTVFDIIDTEEKAYWLGFLYADGSVHSTANIVELSLKGEDLEHLQKYAKFLHLSTPPKLYNSKCNGKLFSRCRCFTCNEHFKKRLIELGCFPRKSLTLKFPNIDVFRSPKLIIHFIRGYFDGDGCISFTKSGRLNIQLLGTQEFLTGVQSILPQFSSIRKADNRRPNSNTYVIYCNCAKADEVMAILYKDASIYLQRKYNRYCRSIQK